MKEGSKAPVEIEKVVEDCKRLGDTASHFYPSKLGGDEAAYAACKKQAADNEIYWDPKLESFYYYIPKYNLPKRT